MNVRHLAAREELVRSGKLSVILFIRDKTVAVLNRNDTIDVAVFFFFLFVVHHSKTFSRREDAPRAPVLSLSLPNCQITMGGPMFTRNLRGETS